MLNKCESTINNVLAANEANQLTEGVADTLADCIRGQVIEADLNDTKLQYTINFLESVESQAKNGTGLFEGYQP